ncbi:hypothetical protein [Haloferula sp. BvORR071]|uniref:hypothetical protein n=1 Tax=Haloferula sp. BvORR071 TaxID=1396141 RepID=UPI00054DE010|nr:hypothetical protein [Haloferula sp. BvORR071]
MKTPLAFLAGAAVGAIAMWLAQPKGHEAAAEKVPGKVEVPQVTHTNSKPTEDAQDGLPTKTKRPAGKEEEEPDAVVLDDNDMNSAEMSGLREAMAKELGERKQRRIDERLSALKSRLNLDDATAAKVKALLEAGDEEEDLLQKVAAGDDLEPPQPGEEARKRAATEQEIAKLLTPEQASAFTQFTAEQRENRIEVATGREMTRLQQELTLTPDQKDKVFQALNQVAAKEDESGGLSITADVEEMKARRQSRLDALKPILTAEQYQAYERSSQWMIQIQEVK